jgi:hypothetical protein
MVAGIRSGFVVHKINIVVFGGSSNSFNIAFQAPFDNIWHSSKIYILYLLSNGLNLASSIITLICSTPLLLAASTSIGFPCPSFILFANILADVVFPHPAGPVNK